MRVREAFNELRCCPRYAPVSVNYALESSKALLRPFHAISIRTLLGYIYDCTLTLNVQLYRGAAGSDGCQEDVYNLAAKPVRPASALQCKSGSQNRLSSLCLTVAPQDGARPKAVPRAMLFPVRQVVDDFLEGFNGTIFAYGQTGSPSPPPCVAPYLCIVIACSSLPADVYTYICVCVCVCV